MFTRLILPITYQCNLNCQYCYVDKRLKKAMKLAVAFSAVDFLLKMNRKSGKAVDLIFVGGEPLLEWKKIIKIIFYIKRLAKKMKIQLGVIGFPTNGLLLNEKILAFCQQEEIQVAVSLDGNLNKREMVGGGNSFDFLKSKLPLLLQYRKIVRIRSTIHPDYVEWTVENFDKLIKLGFEKIDLQPVIGTWWHSAKQQAYLKNLKICLQKIAVHNAKKAVKIDSKHLRDALGDCQDTVGCPKVKEEFLVDLDGRIYPCEFYLSVPWEKRKKYALGDLHEGVEIGKAKKCLQQKICDSGKNKLVGKEKCQVCKQSQACYKLCLGYNKQKDLFEDKLAQNSWEFFRKIEKIFQQYGHEIIFTSPDKKGLGIFKKYAK